MRKIIFVYARSKVIQVFAEAIYFILDFISSFTSYSYSIKGEPYMMVNFRIIILLSRVVYHRK